MPTGVLAESLHTYHIGNSLTWDPRPDWGLGKLAADAGHTLTAGYHIRCNSSLDYIAGHPIDTCVTPNSFGYYTDALLNNTWDAVTLQPFGSASTPSTPRMEYEGAKSLIQLARQNPDNLGTTFYLYTGWMSRTDAANDFYSAWHDSSPIDPDADLIRNAASFGWVYDELANDPDLAGVDLRMIPVGDVLAELDRRMTLGEITGFAGVEDLYRDDLHMNNLGWFAASNAVLSTLFMMNPTGTSTNNAFVLAPGQAESIEITPELGLLIQDAVWDVVLSHPHTGFLPGDLDGDGFVGIADLNVVLGNWNQAVTPSGDHADPSGDGYVGIEDLNTVLGNWNAGAPPLGSISTPEPHTGYLFLILFGAGGLGCRARGNPAVSIMPLVLVCATHTYAGQSIINQGTRDWVSAATTGRADMLILGDSVVNHGLGWTGGIANAARTRLGVAGTGLYASLLSVGDLERYPGIGGGYLHMSASWFGPASNLGPVLQGYAVGGNVNVSPGGATTFRQSVGIYDDLLDRSGAMTWQLWATMTGEVPGSVQANRVRRVLSPASGPVLETSPAATVDPYAGSLQLVELAFAAAPGDVSDWHEFNLTATPGAAVFYNRLIDPNATGITVTGWGYPGGTVNNHYSNLYTADRSAAGRAEYLKALVAGNSGKLNVVLAFGINDSGKVEPSLVTGITPGYQVAGFIENITAQIDLITADWAFANLDPADLSFTLPSTYQVGPEVIGVERVARLQQYRDALHDLALTDARISFLDMWDASPTAEYANASGLIHDYIHPSRGGSLFYGALFMNELLESDPLAGDLDGDGFVGIADLNIILGLWNQQFDEPWIDLAQSKDYRADTDYDGFVGIADLNTVLGNWNAGTPPPDVAAQVPEPSAGVVMVVSGLWLRRRAR